jgi:hypothetical protein
MTQNQKLRLAKKYGASVRTIERYAKEGAPLDDPAKMLDFIESRKHRPAGYDNAPASKARGKAAAGEINWGKELKKWQALREEIAYLRERGEVLPAAPLREQTKTCLAVLFGSLERIFATEFPASVKGMDELAIRTKALAAVEELRGELVARFGAIVEGASND